jgi:hypothetical protein
MARQVWESTRLSPVCRILNQGTARGRKVWRFRLSRLRSSAVYGFVQVQNTEAQPGSAFHQSNYTAGNLISNPYGSLTLGMEFLYSWRVNKDGSSGKAPRIMFLGRQRRNKKCQLAEQF